MIKHRRTLQCILCPRIQAVSQSLEGLGLSQLNAWNKSCYSGTFQLAMLLLQITMLVT